MKKNDIIFVALLFFIGLSLLIGFKVYEASQATGNLYAKVIYKDQTILMIDLESNEFKIYDTIYKTQIDTGLSEEGIFYVPGSETVLMEELYLTDTYARDRQIVGIKILVQNQKIQVVYQESPKDICELQRPTNSSLEPIVCLPNELVIQVYTNLGDNALVIDSVLE